MTKVDFYTLRQSQENDRLFFACRLVEKAFNLGHRIYLHTDSAQSAEELDDLLWSFRPESFLPHALVGFEADEDDDIPILIGYAGHYDGPRDLLINLSRELPPFHGEFQRISEIVINDEQAKQISRQHWKQYQEAGCELQHHDL